VDQIIVSILASPEVQASIATVLLTVITGLVTAASRALFGWLKANTSAKQFALLQELAAVAVKAAEQGAIAGFVNDRKATAVNIVNEGLKNAGIKNLTAEQIEAAIEAAVLATASEVADAQVARAETRTTFSVGTVPAPEPGDDEPDGVDTV
jgi:hypothetical protein